jgi:cell division septum initiation protein DivIVA
MATGPMNALAKLVADVEELKQRADSLAAALDGVQDAAAVLNERSLQAAKEGHALKVSVHRVADLLNVLLATANDHEERLRALEGRAQ